MENYKTKPHFKVTFKTRIVEDVILYHDLRIVKIHNINININQLDYFFIYEILEDFRPPDKHPANYVGYIGLAYNVLGIEEK